MAKTTREKRAAARVEYWRARIAEQERSGMTVQRFCEDRGLTEQSFYVWRKRLRKHFDDRPAASQDQRPRREGASNGVDGVQLEAFRALARGDEQHEGHLELLRRVRGRRNPFAFGRDDIIDCDRQRGA